MGLGDEILVTGHVREMQLRDPRKVKIIYEKPRWSEVWDYNPRIAGRDEKGDFQEYRPRINGLRPYCSSKSPERWTWKEYKAPIGELYFEHSERNFASLHAGKVVIGPHVKRQASPNKQWSLDRWGELVVLLTKKGIQPVQLGPPGSRRVSGVELIETQSFRLAAAVLSRARAAILTEGALHHAAAVLNIPSVVIYGGFISPKQTGYDSQVNIFTGGEPCGWRIPCKHCAEAMEKITPELVLESFLGLKV